jgi:hypothetical protein
MAAPPEDLVFVDDFEVRGRTDKLGVWALPDPPEWSAEVQRSKGG